MQVWMLLIGLNYDAHVHSGVFSSEKNAQDAVVAYAKSEHLGAQEEVSDFETAKTILQGMSYWIEIKEHTVDA